MTLRQYVSIATTRGSMRSPRGSPRASRSPMGSRNTLSKWVVEEAVEKACLWLCAYREGAIKPTHTLAERVSAVMSHLGWTPLLSKKSDLKSRKARTRPNVSARARLAATDKARAGSAASLSVVTAPAPVVEAPKPTLPLTLPVTAAPYEEIEQVEEDLPEMMVTLPGFLWLHLFFGIDGNPSHFYAFLNRARDKVVRLCRGVMDALVGGVVEWHGMQQDVVANEGISDVCNMSYRGVRDVPHFRRDCFEVVALRKTLLYRLDLSSSCVLNALRRLVIDSADVGSIEPNTFDKTPLLEELVLRNNRLEALPEELRVLSSLKSLDVSFNKLTTDALRLCEVAGGATGLCHLRSLYAAGNQIEDIPLGLASHPCLVLLDVSSNSVPREVLERFEGLNLNVVSHDNCISENIEDFLLARRTA